jgi:glutathione synthase/RimK-type ligase-like ATP-grasp enzyme
MFNVKLIRTRASDSAAFLSKLMGIKRNKLKVWEPRLFKKDKILINWGNSKIFNYQNRVVWNKPEAVAKAVNKLTTFQVLKAANVSIPEFYIKAADLPQRGEKSRYVARSLLTGHSGQGITIVKGNEPIPDNTLLITQYIKKKIELRVHVAFGKVILTVQKRRRNGIELTNDNQYVRSFDNGWIFSQNISPEVEPIHLDMAVRAVQALGLDFGAVDMVLSAEGNLPYILEVNTAPAIVAESTQAAYKKAFTERVELLRAAA